MKFFKNIIIVTAFLIAAGCSSNPTAPLIYTGKVPFPVSPSDGAIIGNFTITLTVRNAADYNDAASTYLFQISTDKNFNPLILSQAVPGSSGYTSLAFTLDLSANNLYYWRVKASHGQNSTDFSIPFEFIIQAYDKAPEPLSPAAEQVVINSNVMLRAKNSPYFSSQHDFYRFEIFSIHNPDTPLIVKEVLSQTENTQVQITDNIAEGGYTWRVRAYRKEGKDSESTFFSPLTKFYIAENCNRFNHGQWGYRIVENNVACGSYNSYSNPNEALGSPDARSIGDEVYEGFVSLGIDGWIVVEMGECIGNAPGDDLRVFQTVSYEGVGVKVAPTPDGPWSWLGAVRCDGSSDYYSHVCYFDLSFEGATAPWARFVKVIDYERLTMPQSAYCDIAAPFPGADIDSVQVLHSYQ